MKAAGLSLAIVALALSGCSTVRDRVDIRRQVKTLSAEGRLSAYVLLALPIAIAGMVLLVALRPVLRVDGPTFTSIFQGGIRFNNLIGFAIAGADKHFVTANARLISGRVVVASPDVKEPVAVRYAWADNPVCNLTNAEGLPVTPFRTDDFPMITDPANPNSAEAQNAKRAEELKKLMEARKRAGKK